MSGGAVQQFSAMIPRLRAEEALRLVDVHAIGSGAVDKKDRTRWLTQQERIATAAKPQRASSWEEHFQRLRSMGLNVVVDEGTEDAS